MSTLAIIDTRHVYHWVFGIYVFIGLAVFALFTVAIIGTAIWFRMRPPGRPARWYEANKLEIAYAITLTAVAAFLLYVTFTAEHQIDTVSAHERPALTIDVTGARWEWTYSYPRYGITRESGLVDDQPLTVPRDEPVRFHLRSTDVIHGFWIPEVDFKRDAIPGAVETFTLDFDHTGSFSGYCSEFCGTFHSEMVFTVHVLKPGVFRAWARSAGHRHMARVGGGAA